MKVKLGTNNIREVRLGNKATSIFSFYEALDEDAERFIIAADIQSPTIITAINNLVIGMKDANIWDKMQVVYPFVNGTEQSCQLNLKNPLQYPIEFQGSWTFSQNGINSSNANNDIGIIPLILSDVPSFSVTNWGMGMYSRTNSQDGYDLCALWVDDPAARQQNVIITRFTNDAFYFGLPIFGVGGQVPNTNGSGFFQSNKSGGTVRAYRNGTLLDTESAVSSNAPNQVIGIGNLPVIIDKNPSGRQYAFCYIGIQGLSNAEAQTYYTIVQNFQTGLGRQV
jgi:hypothetical protein